MFYSEIISNPKATILEIECVFRAPLLKSTAELCRTSRGYRSFGESIAWEKTPEL